MQRENDRATSGPCGLPMTVMKVFHTKEHQASSCGRLTPLVDLCFVGFSGVGGFSFAFSSRWACHAMMARPNQPLARPVSLKLMGVGTSPLAIRSPSVVSP
jgi:hypothetical protein